MSCFLLCSLLFFFFKQKTAYEMRISDWSSDVCSSDLEVQAAQTRPPAPVPGWRKPAGARAVRTAAQQRRRGQRARRRRRGRAGAADRSEEHTSELQSLMRISYAVFCLKKKKQTKYKIVEQITNSDSVNIYSRQL